MIGTTGVIVIVVLTPLFCGIGVPLIINWLFDKFGRRRVMARYIDADALLLKIDLHGTNKFGMLDEDIREFVKQIPTADVAEVVRCKDCKHFGRDMGYGKHDCKKYEMPYCLENDYCSYGERRTDDEG